MQDLFQLGDQKTYMKAVTSADFAQFEAGLVHPVCSTFALGQAMEWASRLFVLEMKDADEEGIGTMLHIDHQGPAFAGETLQVVATYKNLTGNALLCDISVHAGERLVATGQTGQKILKKEKLHRLLTNKPQ
ncbi:thioesterase family protein [Nibribacter koreensis]|uniref:Fluoroacetyl-CoA-specific thioesterase-like domain-containing protein n=1 Tax=Nibribacter koreensis TaxID=1084519 RepID=A0ABP8F7F0_9BACT